jgi:hypothetical protein
LNRSVSFSSVISIIYYIFRRKHWACGVHKYLHCKVPSSQYSQSGMVSKVFTRSTYLLDATVYVGGPYFLFLLAPNTPGQIGELPLVDLGLIFSPRMEYSRAQSLESMILEGLWFFSSFSSYFELVCPEVGLYETFDFSSCLTLCWNVGEDKGPRVRSKQRVYFACQLSDNNSTSAT